MEGEMNTFNTTAPTLECATGDKIIYPFSPPIFQSEVSQSFIDSLLYEGDKLTKEKDDWRPKLAGNMKYGGSYIYSNEFTIKAEKYLLQYLDRFLFTITKAFGPEQVTRLVEKPNFAMENRQLTGGHDGKIALDTMWINYQKKHDYNPPHTHKGVLSFVIFCKVPQKIFEEPAVSNTKDQGKIIFQHGESMTRLMGNLFPVTPYERLMFMFPAQLNHFVPSFWTDETRVSVSGNFIVV